MDPVPPSGARNRRTSRRLASRSGIRVSVRVGTTGLGPNLAVGYVDVSADGVCVRLKTPLKPGSEAEVCFEQVGSNRPLKMMAEVRWCTTDPDGACRAGLQFRRRLLYSQLVDLVRS